MGILDDAIREHLELKRKHGVPEDEVERQEEEALGPARRDVAQQPEDAEIAADAGDDASLFDGEHGDAPVAEEPAVAGDETAIAEAPAEAPADAPFAEAPVEAPFADPPAEAPLAEAAEAPPVEPVSEEAPERSHPSQITRAWRRRRPSLSRPRPSRLPSRLRLRRRPSPTPTMRSATPSRTASLRSRTTISTRTTLSRATPSDDPLPGSDAEDEELDVLEDTPDFLQETPEHDRLWFEQKPPRDFDFD